MTAWTGKIFRNGSGQRFRNPHRLTRGGAQARPESEARLAAPHRRAAVLALGEPAPLLALEQEADRHLDGVLERVPVGDRPPLERLEDLGVEVQAVDDDEVPGWRDRRFGASHTLPIGRTGDRLTENAADGAILGELPVLRLGEAVSCQETASSSLGDARSCQETAFSSLGDAVSCQETAFSSLGDAVSSLGDAVS